MKNLNALWSRIKTTDQKEKNVLELLKQGKKEQEIREKLELNESSWRKIRRSLFGKLKELVQPQGIKLTYFPSERHAEYIIQMLDRVIVVAYVANNIVDEELLDEYLTSLEDKGFEVREISTCSGEDNDLLVKFENELADIKKPFSLILEKSFSKLIHEIRKTNKNVVNISQTYNYLLERGFIWGEVKALREELRNFSENTTNNV